MKHANLVVLLKLAVVIAGLVIAGESQAEPPTMDEVLAVHRKNLERLKNLHLQATVTTQWTEAFRDSHRQEARKAEKMIELFESGKLTDDDLSPQLTKIGYNVSQWVSSLKSKIEVDRAVANNTQIREWVEVFARGADYQVRTPLVLPAADDRDWKFPEAEVTAESLLSDYGTVQIYTRSESLAPKARVWCGVMSSTGSPGTALLMDGHFNESQGLVLPPYLPAIPARWNMAHLIAKFFKDPAQKFEIIREEEVGGRALVVVDAVAAHDYRSSRLDENGNRVEFQGFDLYRGWLDMSRGAVPVKLQWWVGTEQVSHEQIVSTHPEGTLTSSTIQELESGAFYPAVTVLERYGPVMSEDLKEVLRCEVHQRKTWSCSLIESPVVLPEEFFVLDFPQGQTFYDMDNQKMLGALDPKPVVRPGAPAPPLTNVKWLDGGDHSLEEFRSKVVVIDFWGLWCSACRNSIPALIEVQEYYRDQPVTFVAIHNAEANQEALATRIKAFADEEGWQIVQAIDSGKASHNSMIANAYGMSGFPTEVIIAPDGRVAYNSGVPLAGLEDLVGKTSDEVTLEDEQRMETYMRKQFEGAGIEWPDDEELSQEEQIERTNQLHVYQLKQQIDAALKTADGR